MKSSGCVLPLVLALCAPALAQTPLTSVLVADGFEHPLFMTHAPNDYNRLFVVERGDQGTGRIKIINLATGQVLPTPFLSLPVAHAVIEQGLLGLAFDPDYANNGFFYTYRVAPIGVPGVTMVERHRVSASNPNVADPLSTTVVVRRPALSDHHNAGWMDFGPDGYLYIAYGDNGEIQSAQNPDFYRAKIHRIDPDSDAFPADPDHNYSIPATNPWVGLPGADETWVWGLRNPWRCSFDRLTGDLWVSDVGLSDYEEVNIKPVQAGPPFTALNYGWYCYEGPLCIGLFGCNCAAPYTAPVYYYPHGGSPFRCAITGGYVYRGCAIPDLQGTYFFSDYCSAQFWSFRYVGGQVTQLTNRTAEINAPQPFTISSFGEDALGELYFCSLDGGGVFKIVPATPVGPDCNGNGRRDACDIMSGFSTDGNGNGVPDECDCYPNCNGSYSGATPTLTVSDFGCFQTKWVAGHPYADCNDDGQLTVSDFGCFQTKFVIGCP